VLEHPVYKSLYDNIQTVGHCLCVGLDPDLTKIPEKYSQDCDGVEHFLKDIIDASQDNVIAYKPNISFFEALGIPGLQMLEKICEHIPESTPTILDGKRGDIGNTATMQAKYIFDYFNADAITVNPYMGEDSVEPFLAYKDKLVFVLALTSNHGANDFERQMLQKGIPMYLSVIETVTKWAEETRNLGFVVGATQSELQTIRSYSEYPFLIPGVGQQGGSYHHAMKGADKNGVCVINVSRSVLYGHSQSQPLKLAVSEVIQSTIK
jgi:orotidine-5'-phosphate decarboxylase